MFSMSLHNAVLIRDPTYGSLTAITLTWGYRNCFGVTCICYTVRLISNLHSRWSFLTIRDYRGNRNTTDEELAYLAGVMEANLTASLMEMHWQNTMGNYCTANPDLCDKLVQFILENNVYTGTDRNMSDPRWYQVGLGLGRARIRVLIGI